MDATADEQALFTRADKIVLPLLTLLTVLLVSGYPLGLY